ncbi:RNA-guided endonuclease TnpB family protein [Lyngbya aestuarii]|uniref:RNA-guided endonuclease TnpB family protein n=1 Tax=Lyngbya aestuarii TaxID=118322 RepID=UPI00403E07C3
MKQFLTIVCQLQPSPEQVLKIEELLKAFAEGCNYANQNVKTSITSKTTIQNLVYQSLREQFGLSANQAVRVCARVGANRKTAKLKGRPVKEFKPTSADYDARIFSFREKDWAVSLTLLNGREHIRIDAGNYQRGKLKGRTPTSAQLCKHRDGKYYIHIQIKDDAPNPVKTQNVIGVDFGRRDVAVTSNGDKWDGTGITKARDKFSNVRASLQAKVSRKRDASPTKGTRTTRRRVRNIWKRLSGRERRYQTWLNHTISRAIIRDALKSGSLVAIEDLTGIRNRSNQQPRSKTERRRSNSWAFYQLRQFLEYKGIQSGVEVVAVSPRYTSQTCHQCLRIGLRSGKRFGCTNKGCNWHGDADVNGSEMIRLVGLSVTQPEGSKILSCELSWDSSGLLKAPCL